MDGNPNVQGAPATRWACGARELDLSRARVMGIVNVTPDSFSDGGLHDTVEGAVSWGMRLLDEGADILDVGGESTRPGFTPVPSAEEGRRVLPVVRALAAEGALVSVDTRHADVAAAALEAGAAIVNDVSGFSDPAMREAVAGCGCGCVVMHSRPGHLSGGMRAEGPLEGAAAAKVGASDALDEAAAVGDAPACAAFPQTVERALLEGAARLEGRGVARERICIDPGPGFGTTAGQDVAVQEATGRLAGLGYPLLCAVSRKRFVGAVSGANPAVARDAASAGVALAAVARGARVVRTHNVAMTAEALRAAEACSGRAPRKRAFIALGSNMGDRVGSLRAACRSLGDLPLTDVVSASEVYETEAAYLASQPPFANAVVEVSTGLHPIALLEAALAIEAAMGRVRTVENGPRPIDIDLLWMEGETHVGRRLALPHPRMGERAFVLLPLADLVGDARSFCASAGVGTRDADECLGRAVGRLGRLL